MLGIVVVSFGSASLLRANLAGLDRTAMRTPSTVVVVDNFRGSGARDAVRAVSHEHGWELVENATNAGFGTAANAGVARATALGCTAVVVVNPDAAVDAHVLDELAEQLAASPHTLVSPRVLRPDGRPWFTGGRIDLRAGRTRNVDLPATERTEGWLSGACLAADTSWWRTLGGFDDDYFLYWEDVDLSYRCTRAGGSLLVRQDLEVLHDVGGTQEPTAGGRAKSSTYYYYNCRNRLLFAARHLGPGDVRRWLLGQPAYAWSVLMRGGRRQLLRPWTPVSAAVRGSFSGARFAVRALRGRPDLRKVSA